MFRRPIEMGVYAPTVKFLTYRVSRTVLVTVQLRQSVLSSLVYHFSHDIIILLKKKKKEKIWLCAVSVYTLSFFKDIWNEEMIVKKELLYIKYGNWKFPCLRFSRESCLPKLTKELDQTVDKICQFDFFHFHRNF